MKTASGPTAFRVDVLVQPRAKHNRIVGWHGSGLKIQVSAPPVDGAANEAVIELVADALDLAKSQVRIVRGETSRAKTLEVAATAAHCLPRLQACAPGFVDIPKGRA